MYVYYLQSIKVWPLLAENETGCFPVRSENQWRSKGGTRKVCRPGGASKKDVFSIKNENPSIDNVLSQNDIEFDFVR